MVPIKIRFVLPISVALFSLVGFQVAGDFYAYCQKTSYPEVCTQVIEGCTDSYLKLQFRGWLEILNSRSVSFVLTARTQFDDVLTKNPSPDQKRCLDICSHRFGLAYTYINETNLFWADLNGTNYLDYNLNLGIGLFYVDECIKAFAPYPSLNPAALLTQGADDAIKLVLEVLNLYQCVAKTPCPPPLPPLPPPEEFPGSH